jgi:hypothetical protein
MDAILAILAAILLVVAIPVRAVRAELVLAAAACGLLALEWAPITVHLH